jgi:hypothetical protein
MEVVGRPTDRIVVCGLSRSTTFFYNITERVWFSKNINWYTYKMCLSISSSNYVWNIFYSKKNICVFLCIFCVVCIVCFVSFSLLFVCICVLNYCHRVANKLQLNVSYHIIISYILYHIIYHIIPYNTISYHIYHITDIIIYIIARIDQCMTINIYCCSVKYSLFMSYFMKLEFPGQIFEKFFENPSSGILLFHAHRPKDGKKAMPIW